MLINADLQILQFRGPTSAYLEPPTGKASFDVLKMARQGLMLPLRAAINKAKKDNTTARKDNVRVQQNGKTRTVNLKVIPLKNVRERCFLIVFEDAASNRRARRRPADRLPFRTQQGERSKLSGDSRRISDLETDLAETRDYLQSMQEQHEAANEELQASNEEVQSANEELQSVNEELETSKEELESANEELTTVNEEMANRNIELTRLNGDLVNLQTSIKLAIVLLGRDLTIRRFSAQAEKQFDLLATDVGRPISNIRHNLVFEERGHQAASAVAAAPGHRRASSRVAGEAAMKAARPDAADVPPDLETLIAEVIATVHEREREVRDKRAVGITCAFAPTSPSTIRWTVPCWCWWTSPTSNRRNRPLSPRANMPRPSSRPYASRCSCSTTNCASKAPIDPSIARSGSRPPRRSVNAFFDLGNRQWDIPRLRTMLEEVLPRDSTMEDFLVEHTFEQLGPRSMLLNARRMHREHGTPLRVLLAIEDITERKQTADAQERLAAIVESSDDAIVSKDLNGVIKSWNEGAERLFGYTAQEAVGRPVLILIPPDREDEEPSILEHISRGESIDHYETVRRRKDGSLVEVSLTVSPIKDARGRIIGASKIARDMTGRKQVEKTLRQSHADLQSHMEELTRFNRVAVGRELRMIELKKEVNELCRRHGEAARYPLDFESEGKAES